MMKPALKIQALMPTRWLRYFLLAALLIPVFAPAAHAGCAPGIPCIVNATPNDPTNPGDGPTAPGAPNQPKVTGGGSCTGANPAPGCACDADFMNQIYSRAWLESQRDQIKAEILIRKPDSILEYTCFNQFGDLAVARAGPIFSESTRWRPTNVTIDSEWGPGFIDFAPIPFVTINVYMGPNKLSNSIRNLVQTSLQNYINNSFGHRFLGGAATTLDYTATSGAGGYNCTYMDRVYFLSKCSDIVTDDRFWRFSELISPDPRLLPQACTAGTQVTQQRIDLAENLNFQYVNFDRIVTFNDLLRPPGGGVTCAPPIPTGIMVTDKSHGVDAQGNVTVTGTATYEDKACPNPNCYYDRGTQCLP